jgi:hypothetical protein
LSDWLGGRVGKENEQKKVFAEQVTVQLKAIDARFIQPGAFSTCSSYPYAGRIGQIKRKTMDTYDVFDRGHMFASF